MMSQQGEADERFLIARTPYGRDNDVMTIRRKAGSARIHRRGRRAAVFGGTLICAIALTGCVAGSGAIRTPTTDFSSAGVDWVARGNYATDDELAHAAMTLWDTKSGTGHTAEHVLFLGDTGIAGLADGQCGLVVLAGQSSTGAVRIGWFVSQGKPTTTNLAYLGETKPASARNEQSLLTVVNCPNVAESTSSPIPSPANSPDPTPRAGSSLRLLGLAAPGYELQAPAGEDISVTSKMVQGAVMSREIVTDNVNVDLVKGSTGVRTFDVPFTPPSGR
jgi:hypothetical protein